MKKETSKMNNLPIVHKENFFSKIINVLKKLLLKKKKDVIMSSENEGQNDKKVQNEEIKFTQNLKYEIATDVSKEYRKKEFLEKIEANPKLLDDLSLEQLKQLNQYYNEIILDYKNKINALKNT